MTPHTKRIIFDIAGLTCCLLPPCACTLAYFPVWEETVGTTALCGGTLGILIFITLVVVGKYVRTRLKTPSPAIMFGAAWLMLALIEKTVTGIKNICFFGFVGGCVGAVLFMIGNKIEDKDKKGDS